MGPPVRGMVQWRWWSSTTACPRPLAISQRFSGKAAAPATRRENARLPGREARIEKESRRMKSGGSDDSRDCAAVAGADGELREPLVGFEPTTARLRIESSTPELQWRDGVSNGCPGADSNRDAFRHYPLKIACLPVSPPGRAGKISEGKPVSQPQLRTLLVNGLPLIWAPPSRISILSSPVKSGVYVSS